MLSKYIVNVGHPQEMRTVNHPWSYEVFAESEEDALSKAKERHKKRFGIDDLLYPDVYKVETPPDSIGEAGPVTDTALIDQIRTIRAQNNDYWMELVKLAFEVSPIRARAIMKKIVQCDSEIKELSERLANNEN